MAFRQAVEFAALAVEALGVATIVLGAPAAALFVWKRHRLRLDEVWYDAFRRFLARAILLGLEFLVAADIIRTVAQEPTLPGVTVLALIILIRTFLAFTLEVEIEGRWPWQKPVHPPISVPDEKE
ncbi:MAG: DUF1622 domain-containing protein [Myxococcales bacterium]|jgi:uncharacterized membrane protein